MVENSWVNPRKMILKWWWVFHIYSTYSRVQVNEWHRGGKWKTFYGVTIF